MVRYRIGDGGHLSLISSIIGELVATLSKRGSDYYIRYVLSDTSAIAMLQATEGILKSTRHCYSSGLTVNLCFLANFYKT
jgi:hypothetical protein